MHKKIEAYELMGDSYSQGKQKNHLKALKCYKKLLEQAWSLNDLDYEIKAYEKISI